MHHDSLVSAADVLAAMRQVRQAGLNASLSDLERREPELLAMMLEQLSDLNHRLDEMQIPYKAQRRLRHALERLFLQLVYALEAGQRRLWSDMPDRGVSRG